ncbi:MAG: cell surface protein [Bradymonadaceae bacterium]|nr:cell surface protein [Lujinxingiaceae bacterium]
MRALGLMVIVVGLATPACVDEVVDEGPAAAPPLPYASEVVSFSPGEGAGYGQDRLPDVVLGPPSGKGVRAASLDVLSLGKGGEIILGFGERSIVDGPGPDFIVFENAFWPRGEPQDVFAELGEVSVSEDGVAWTVFACETDAAQPGRWPGCAGWSPTLVYEPYVLLVLDTALTGGDVFDLSDVGLERARFVRIRDLSFNGSAPSAGFDLDAVGLINWHLPTRGEVVRSAGGVVF